MNRWLTVFLFVITLTSCQEFDFKKQSAEEILEKELKSINWNEVDFYPTFDSCGSVTSKEESKTCFENKIKTSIENKLIKEKVITTNQSQDTIIIALHISEEGETQINGLKIPDQILERNPDLKDWLTEVINELPKIHPAQKRSVPVSLQTQLPIILK
jgi:hypothetical protein